MQVEVTGSAGAKRIVVSLANQTLQALEGGQQVFAFDCVTGSGDHPTTPGTFTISRKDKVHRSAKYDAQMNYAMFFSADGKAIHQYHGFVPLAVVRTMKSAVSDWFGSHGCVRLTEDDAKAVFEWAPVGTSIQIR